MHTQVRFLSEPANRRNLASVGSMGSSGSGALAGAPWPGFAPPASLDWSRRRTGLGADNAALQEYFAQHATGEGGTVRACDCDWGLGF